MYQYTYFTVIQDGIHCNDVTLGDPTRFEGNGEGGGGVGSDHPRDEDSNLVVTPQQVLDLYARGMSLCLLYGGIPYDLKVQWRGAFLGYERVSGSAPMVHARGT